jgi:hypothetical protein
MRPAIVFPSSPTADCDCKMTRKVEVVHPAIELNQLEEELSSVQHFCISIL